MCSRYFIDVELSPELKPYVEAADSSPLREKMVSNLGKNFKAYGEIRPNDMAAVIAPSSSGKIIAFPMIWGYHVKGIGQPLFNARVESAAEKKTFSSDWLRHRCVVPATGYYEWEHIGQLNGKRKTGDKYAIHPQGSTATWLAGLYRIEKEQDFYYPVFTILTREPGEAVRRIHDRMPVILPKSEIADWIRPDGDPEKTVEKALTDMEAVVSVAR